MKPYLILAAIFLSLTTFAQSGNRNKANRVSIQSDSAKKKSDSLRRNINLDSATRLAVDSNLIDTVQLAYKDLLPIDSLLNKSQKLYLINEVEDKNDWFFQYVFPIITLILGAAIVKYFDYVQFQRKTKKDGEYWMEEADAYITIINEQAKKLENYAKSIIKDKYEMINYPIIHFSDGRIFSGIDRSTFIKYLQRKNNLEKREAIIQAYKLMGSLNSLSDIGASLNKDQQIVKTRFNSIYSSYNKLINELNKTMLEWEAHAQNLPQNDPLAIAFNGAFYIKLQNLDTPALNGPLDPFDISANFSKSFINYISPHRNVPLVIKLITIVQDMGRLTSEVAQERLLGIKVAQNHADAYIKGNQELKDAIIDIEGFNISKKLALKK